MRSRDIGILLVTMALCGLTQGAHGEDTVREQGIVNDRREITRVIESIEFRLGLRLAVSEGEPRPLSLPDIVTRLEDIDNHLARREREARKAECPNNLRRIDAAKEQAALATGTTEGTIADNVLGPYIHGGSVHALRCHSGGRYKANPLGTDPECSVHGKLSQAVAE